MSVTNHINTYLQSLPLPKQKDLKRLHEHVISNHPTHQLWFLDGKDASGKIVTNPNIGYGHYPIRYSNGTKKDWYKIGLTATSTGISIYVFGYEDKSYLKATYGSRLGKATITGYCIKFKSLEDINFNVLTELFQAALS